MSVADPFAVETARPYGDLPEWNLADLYPSRDSPELQAALGSAEAQSVAFEERWKGKLAEIAGAPKPAPGSPRRSATSKRSRTCSAASSPLPGCSTPATQSDPAISKFYGDVQEKITNASSHLLFFTLELNRIDDAILDVAMEDPTLGYYRPWLEDIRKEKPHQLEDRVEQLFHEKS